MRLFPFNTAVETLAPLIRTSQYPYLLGAIKMLTALIDAHSQEVGQEHLQQIMPGLIKVRCRFSLTFKCHELHVIFF